MTFTTSPIVLIDATSIARRTVRGAGADGIAPERPRPRRRTARRGIRT